MKILPLFSLFILLYLPAMAQHGWQEIPVDKDLSAWKQLGGTADYKVNGNTITGVAKLGTPNSFLATKRTYDNFVLEFEVYLDNALNSGVQIRSNSDPDYRDGRVHGYQMELDPSSRGFSGGIYDEARRGWLYPLSRNDKARRAFKLAAWNKVHIEAIGNTINTWINGIHCARLADDMTKKGFIALQVHDIRNHEELEGAAVKWRNFRIAEKELDQYLFEKDPQVDEISYLHNRLTDWEVRRGWRLLWDGKSSEGWRSANAPEFPDKGWVMEAGVLTIEGSDGAESAGPGDIITRDQFSDFELVLDFRITEGANSGIKYFVDPELNKGGGSAIGCEFQILDDRGHPDANQGVDGNRKIGSLYDLIPAENLSIDGRSKQFKGIGNWNRARIISKDGHVEHWLNEEKVVEYDRFSQMFKALVGKSKYRNWEAFGRWAKGHILLQDHGNTVSFKNIKIKEL